MSPLRSLHWRAGACTDALVGALALAFIAFTGPFGCDTRSPGEGRSVQSAAPGGARADQAGADDRDGDGILGAADQCPDEPGLAPKGCPLRDDDGDGILNPEDRCPDVCEVYNGIDDDDGCPEPNPGDDPEIVAILGPIEGLSFDIRRATIRPSSYARLDAIAKVLLRHSGVGISVSGHSDDRLPELMRRISITGQRADSVVAYLIMKGVARDRLESVDFGPDRPIESNKSAEGRAKNRRVELSLRGPEPAVAPGCVRIPNVGHSGSNQ